MVLTIAYLLQEGGIDGIDFVDELRFVAATFRQRETASEEISHPRRTAAAAAGVLGGAARTGAVSARHRSVTRRGVGLFGAAARRRGFPRRTDERRRRGRRRPPGQNTKS